MGMGTPQRGYRSVVASVFPPIVWEMPELQKAQIFCCDTANILFKYYTSYLSTLCFYSLFGRNSSIREYCGLVAQPSGRTQKKSNTICLGHSVDLSARPSSASSVKR